jgi:ankyrin repeat protein
MTLQVVKQLMQDCRVDVSAQNNYALLWASGNGHLDVVLELAKRGTVCIDVSISEAARWAKRGGHTDVLLALVRILGHCGFDE